MNANFRVTYDIVTPESAECGCVEDSGFVDDGCTLRDAIDHLGGEATEADCSPFSLEYPPRWFTNYGYDENYRTGERESRSLHLPDNITAASAMRIARLLGVTS